MFHLCLFVSNSFFFNKIISRINLFKLNIDTVCYSDVEYRMEFTVDVHVNFQNRTQIQQGTFCTYPTGLYVR